VIQVDGLVKRFGRKVAVDRLPSLPVVFGTPNHGREIVLAVAVLRTVHSVLIPLAGHDPRDPFLLLWSLDVDPRVAAVGSHPNVAVIGADIDQPELEGALADRRQC
jgi:hypothetical protein